MIEIIKRVVFSAFAFIVDKLGTLGLNLGETGMMVLFFVFSFMLVYAFLKEWKTFIKIAIATVLVALILSLLGF